MEINSGLNLNSHFERYFKRASGRLRLLAKLKDYLNLKPAKAIYIPVYDSTDPYLLWYMYMYIATEINLNTLEEAFIIP